MLLNGYLFPLNIKSELRDFILIDAYFLHISSGFLFTKLQLYQCINHFHTPNLDSERERGGKQRLSYSAKFSRTVNFVDFTVSLKIINFSKNEQTAIG